ncbi:CAP domain-containing protein [Lutibacter sp. B1]|nr:CAP domain-containing protein [Lutibacter sp. B1]
MLKSIIVQISTLFLISLILFSCTKEEEVFKTSSDKIGVLIDTTSVTCTSIETEILDLVNEHRKSLGMQTLKPLTIISAVAESHTKYMIETGEVNHDDFYLREQALVSEAGAKSVAENVAYGYVSASNAVNAWLQSESHRNIIENPNFTHFGISIDTNTEGRNYFTQMFIKK